MKRGLILILAVLGLFLTSCQVGLPSTPDDPVPIGQAERFIASNFILSDAVEFHNAQSTFAQPLPSLRWNVKNPLWDTPVCGLSYGCPPYYEYQSNALGLAVYASFKPWKISALSPQTVIFSQGYYLAYDSQNSRYLIKPVTWKIEQQINPNWGRGTALTQGLKIPISELPPHPAATSKGWHQTALYFYACDKGRAWNCAWYLGFVDFKPDFQAVSLVDPCSEEIACLTDEMENPLNEEQRLECARNCCECTSQTDETVLRTCCQVYTADNSEGKRVLNQELSNTCFEFEKLNPVCNKPLEIGT